MNVLDELRRLGRLQPAKAPPIPLAIPGVGRIGHIENRRGLYINSGLQNQVDAIIRDDDRSAVDSIRHINNARSSLASWDDFVTAKSSGKSMEAAYSNKGNLGTIDSGSWVHLASSAGWPPAISPYYGAAPGPAALDSNTTGAVPLPMALGAGENLYLGNIGMSVITGNRSMMVMLIDLLQAVNVDPTSALSQNISTTANPRWTGGAGLQIGFEALTNNGGTGVLSIAYVNQSGGNSTTTLTANTALRATEMMYNSANGSTPFVPLASADYGVQSISTVTMTTTSTGTAGIIIYKPLAMFWLPAITNTDFNFSERATPSQLGSAYKLTEINQGSKPFLSTMFSSTGGASLSGFFELYWG